MENITTLANGTLEIFYLNGIHAYFNPSDGLTGYFQANQTAYGNITLFLNSEVCTLDTCDLSLSHFDYLPSGPGNAFYAVVFGLLLLGQIFLGCRYRMAKGYTISMVLGMAGEVVGYSGRILLRENPFTGANAFLINLVPLTIAPAFFTAAIYLSLARIVVLYGDHLSRLRPGAYSLLFCTFDIISLLLQAAGGALASSASSASQVDMGVNIMIAGLCFQVFSLLVFSALCIDFMLRVRSVRNSDELLRQDTVEVYGTKRFKYCYLPSVASATIVIFIRSVYRIAELSGGFSGTLARSHEAVFMILEGAMIIIACACLTFFHPGLFFSKEHWEKKYKIFSSSPSRQRNKKHQTQSIESIEKGEVMCESSADLA